MFAPEDYFELADRLINSYANIEYNSEGPKGFEAGGSWSVITWSAQFTFDSGHRLQISDNYTRRNRKRLLLRNFSYHFMDEDGNCIFRFDTHGKSIPYDGPCHVHRGMDPPAEYREYVDFHTAFRLALRVIKRRPLPWDDPS